MAIHSRFGDKDTTFLLCLQADDGFILVSDSRLVNLSTCGVYNDYKRKIYEVNKYCGLMVTLYPYAFRTFIRELLNTAIRESHDVNSVLERIDKIIQEGRDRFEDIYNTSNEIIKCFPKLEELPFQLIICGYYHKNEVGLIPKIIHIDISPTHYPFLFSHSDYTRYNKNGTVVGEGFLIGGIMETRIQNELQRRYSKVFLPSIDESEKWGREFYNDMITEYCTVGGEPQIAKITREKGFEWINKPDWMAKNGKTPRT